MYRELLLNFYRL